MTLNPNQAAKINQGFYETYVVHTPLRLYSILWDKTIKRNPRLSEMTKIPIPLERQNQTSMRLNPFSVWIAADHYWERTYLKECLEVDVKLRAKAHKLSARFQKFVNYWEGKNIAFFQSLSPEEAEKRIAFCNVSRTELGCLSMRWHECLPMGITPQMVTSKIGKSLVADYGYSGQTHKWETFHPDGTSNKARAVAKKI